jgi:uncharacterized paraquat-inducible protein A
MKNFILVFALLLGSFGIFAQHEPVQKKKEKKAESVEKKEAYQCPMKCEGAKTYAKKGKCPACTMDLKLIVAKK